LGVSDAGHRGIISVGEVALDCPIEAAQFGQERGMTIGRQGFNQVVEHCAQPTHDLDTGRATRANFRARDIDEVFPVRRAVDHAMRAGMVIEPFQAKPSLANGAQQVIELIDGKNRCGRIVNRRRQGLERDVDQDPLFAYRILFDIALGTTLNGIAQGMRNTG